MSERAWFAVECGMHKHEKMAGLPSDSARLGWYAVLAEAKLQRKQGQFASEAHFRAVVGRFARYLKDYVRVDLIDRLADGSLAVHDWQRHQWAAKKAGQREDNGGTNEGQTEDLQAQGRDVPPVFVKTSPGESGSGVEGADALDSWYRLTGSWPTPKTLPWLNDLIDSHGDAAVSDAIGVEWSASSDRKTILGRVQDRLSKEAHESEKRRAAAEAKRADDERRLIESMPAEQRAANLARLREAMAEKGLLRKMKGEPA